MRRVSNFCVALSAAMLLAGGLAEQAQAQDGRQTSGTLSNVGRYDATNAKVVGADYTSARVTAFMDFFRAGTGVNLNAHRLLTVVITPPGANRVTGEDSILLDPVYVREDGTFKKNFGDGSRISG
ncbi:MAG: hypothetical protein GDA41_11880, partial [Rhodospirillales bacterium]|nr:hypothetical protein [Rhodospirillales bacterium]